MSFSFGRIVTCILLGLLAIVKYYEVKRLMTQCCVPGIGYPSLGATMDPEHWVNCKQREKGGLASRNKNCLILHGVFARATANFLDENRRWLLSLAYDKRRIQFTSRNGLLFQFRAGSGKTRVPYYLMLG